MVKKPIRVLNVEDSERDVILLTRHLDAAGYEPVSERVETAAAMKKALEDEEWDIILCDYSMPRFNALNALKVLRQLELDIPFIIISGTVGEEVAVQAMLTGADDYLPKDNLTRLVPAIERELQEAKNRRLQRQTEEERRLTEERYRALFEYAPDGIIIASPESYYLDANAGMCRMLGYSHKELIGMHASDIVAEGEVKHIDKALDEIKSESDYHHEWEFRRKDGSVFIGDVMITTTPDGNLMAIIRDITDRLRDEAAVKQSQKQLNDAQSLAHIGSWDLDMKTGCLEWSDEHYRIFGLPRGAVEMNVDEVIGRCVHPDDVGLVKMALERSLSTLEPFGLDLRVIHPDASVHTVHSIGSVSATENGKAISMHGTAQDVTELRRAESERRVISEIIQGVATTRNLDEFLGLVHRSIGQIVYAENCIVMLHDPVTETFRYHFWADERDPPSLPRPVGYGFGSYVLRTGKPLLLTKEFKKELVDAGEAILSGTPSLSWLGVPLRTPAGTIGVLVLQHYELENVYSVRDLEFLSSVGDQIALVIERKRGEDGLRESEYLLSASQRIAHQGSWVIDLSESDNTGRAKERWSDEHYRIFGFEPGQVEITDEIFYKSIHPDDRTLLSRALREAIEEYKPFNIQHRIILPDGAERIVQAQAELVFDTDTGRPLKVLGSIQDITDREAANAALNESNEKFRQFAAGVADVFFMTSPDLSQMLYVSPAYEKIWGRSTDSLYADPYQWGEAILPDERAAVIETFAGLSSSVPEVSAEFRIARPDGTIRWILSRGFRVIDDDGNVIRLTGIASDITEQKDVEAALAESEASFKSLFETANDALLVVSEGKFLACNQAAERLFGCGTEDILGCSPETFSPLEQPDGQLSSEKAGKYLEAAMNGEPQFFKWKHSRCDGTPFDAEVSLNRVNFNGGAHVQGTIRDITERTELEEQLRQSQKMEAVGSLAGGIAHDFNNLLTAINGYSDLTLKRMSTEDPLRQNIKEVREAGHRAAELTAQLLAFSRKQVLKPRVYNLNAAITEIERMLRRIMRESIDLRTILDPDLGNIKADTGQIEQVIMNLAVNARDAMPDGGILTIETKNVYLDDAYLSQHLMITPGKFVRLTVTDTGHGMDEKTQRQIFEPFFTTKEIGKGTGLGLSTVYGIIKQSGGDIIVYSEVGHGSTFKIYLPCVDHVVEKPRWVGGNIEKYSGTETILLAEDEEVVRNLVRQVLEGNGYNVLEAASGKAALSVCDTHPEPIHMLLTDVVMPKMSGRELRDQVIKLHPDIKVLFMSGYTDDAVAHRGVFDSHNEFIEKPFTPDSLARKVREVLEY